MTDAMDHCCVRDALRKNYPVTYSLKNKNMKLKNISILDLIYTQGTGLSTRAKDALLKHYQMQCIG